MGANPKELIRRWETLRSEQANFRNLWQDVDRYLSLNKDRANTDEFQGEQRTEFVFSGHAPWALGVSSAAIQGTLFPSSIKSFNFSLDLGDLSKADKLWFQTATNEMFAAINKSNFRSPFAETVSDLLAYGTGVLWITERSQGGPSWRGLRFQSFQPRDVVVEEGEDDVVNAVYRQSRPTADKLIQMFGDNVSQRVKRMAERQRLGERVKILHIIKPRFEAKPGKDGLMLDRDMPFMSVWIEEDSKHLLRESGVMEMPYAVPRWSKTNSESYGRGPGILSMPDIRTLNRAVELRLKAWAKAIDPPLLVNDRGVIGPLRMVPGGVNSVRRDGAIQPFINNARFDVSNFSEADLKQAISQAFFIDQIQLPPPTGTPLSATEFAGRFETMQRILGPTFGRVEHELLEVMLKRIFFLMLRRQALTPPPERIMQVLEAEGDRLVVRFDGPLARAQQQAEVESIQRAYGVAAPLAAQFPEVMDRFDHGEAGRLILQFLRVPEEMMMDDEQVAAQQEARAADAQEQQQLAAGATTARALKDATPFLESLTGGGLG